MAKVSFSFFNTFFKSSYTFKTNNSTKNNLAEVRCKFGFPVNQAKDDSEEDCEVPDELARLIEHEEKGIHPHK